MAEYYFIIMKLYWNPAIRVSWRRNGVLPALCVEHIWGGGFMDSLNCRWPCTSDIRRRPAINIASHVSGKATRHQVIQLSFSYTTLRLFVKCQVSFNTSCSFTCLCYYGYSRQLSCKVFKNTWVFHCYIRCGMYRNHFDDCISLLNIKDPAFHSL